VRSFTLTFVAALVLVAPAAAAKWWLPTCDLRPLASVTSEGRGHANLELLRDRNGVELICWTASVRTVQRPFGIFVRRDRTSTPDTTVLKISTAANSPAAWNGSTSVSGCARVANGVIAAIRQAPTRYYLNVPTPRYPQGELRTRLRGPALVRP